MSRYQIASRIVPVPTIGGHIDMSARVSVPRAPWEPAEVRADTRRETAPGPAPIRRKEARQAERSRLTQTLNAIRAEWADHREAQQ